ncbi:MAG: hypothetical protein E3J72_11850 [Planctomycetota bacterium]|nr:MAG: hypothetical protein E3J72_11850 [Planctomycetota bacterium]
MKRVIALVLCLGLLAFAGCTGEDEKIDLKGGGGAETVTDGTRAKAIVLLDQAAAFLMKGYNEKDGSLLPAEQGGFAFSTLGLTAIARAPKEVRQKYEKKIAKTAGFIAAGQNADGSFQARKGETNYVTCCAVMALVAFDREKYKTVIAKAQKYIVDSQFIEEALKGRDKVYVGGWDYDPVDKKDPKKGLRVGADMSNVQFAMEALRESGLPKDSPAWKRAVKFLERSQSRSESNDVSAIIADIQPGNDGGFTYSPTESKANGGQPKILANGKKQYISYASMTYAGLRSFIYAYVKKDDPRVVAAVNWIRKNYTLDENAGMGKGLGMKGYYYYIHTFAKAHYTWGETKFKTADGSKHDWRAELVEKLESLKKADGSYINLQDEKWLEGQPFLCTAYVAEALNMAVKSIDEQK